MDLLKRLRDLPELQKKIIVWGITILVGIGLFAWWIPRLREQMKIEQGPSIEERFQLQDLREQLENIPGPLPEIEIEEQHGE